MAFYYGIHNVAQYLMFAFAGKADIAIFKTRYLLLTQSGRRSATAPTIVLAGLSQRQDDLYVGLIRHRTFCDDEHSYLCVSEAINSLNKSETDGE
jgi:hypothetical protein